MPYGNISSLFFVVLFCVQNLSCNDFEYHSSIRWQFKPEFFKHLISGCLFTARSMFTSLSLSTVYNVIHFIYFNSHITQLQREHILKAVIGKVGFLHGATLLSMRVNWFTNFLCRLILVKYTKCKRRKMKRCQAGVYSKW